MFVELSHQYILPILFMTGLTAGTVDAIAGGGGLISLPVLLGLGIPPHLALGTNKLQSSVGTAMAAYSYYRRGYIDKKKIGWGLFFSCLGAVLGAIIIQILSGDLLRKIIPIVLAGILIYTILSPRFGQVDQPAKINEKLFYGIFGILLGFYDGFLGPGVGSFWVFCFMFFLGFNLVKATAYTKVFNLNTNIIALICFALAQNIDYQLGLCMAAGQLIGGRLGAYLAIKKGTKLIRPFFILICTSTILMLIYRNTALSPSLNQKVNFARITYFSLFIIAAILLYFKKFRQQKVLSSDKE